MGKCLNGHWWVGMLTLVEALAGGAFDHLDCHHTQEFDQNFSKKSNALGVGRMGSFGIDWYITHQNFCRYSRHLEQADIHVKCPWGRARSYAGEAPVYLPDNHRPKWEPPAFLQKGHRHYGSGVAPHPR